MKKISIIIITYNRPDDLLVLLRNIVQQQDVDRLLEEVIIVNNASSVSYDEVTAFIKDYSYFRYVQSNENLGVARGRNLGIAMAKAPILVTLDDDAWFRDTDALIRIESAFESQYMKAHNAGVLCFQVFYASTGQLQVNAFPHKQFNKYKDLPRFLAPYYIGAGHAILKEVYDSAGLYPVDFFYGMEEYDLTYRILDKGYSIAYLSDIAIFHNESPSGRTPQMVKMKMLWINKSKVAYRYLPKIYFLSTALMWSLQFLQKTAWNWKEWLNAWKEVIRIPKLEQRKPLSNVAKEYLRKAGARLWY